MNTAVDAAVGTGTRRVEDAWRDFPGVEGKTYMNVAARGLMPAATRDALVKHVEDFATGDVDKNGYFAMVERVRERFARSIGAHADEIAFMKNITEGINAVAASIDWQAGDNVVICPEIEHPANVYPWLNLQRRGVEVRMVTPRDGILPPAEMAARIDGRTRAVTAATVSFSPGYRTDIAAIGKACRAKGALFLVDAAQSAGILATDVEAMNIDALSCSTQKGMLGVYGMGLLYVRRARAEAIEPAYLSRFGVDLGDASEAELGLEYRLAPGARRFDVGNFNFAACQAADVSLGYLAQYDALSLERYVVGLSNELRRGLVALGLPVCGGVEGPHLVHITTVGHVGDGGHDATADVRMQSLYDHLVANGVNLSIRRGALRFALHLYNRPEDVARVLALAGEWAGRSR